MLSSNSTVNNNAVTLNEKVDSNNKVQYCPIDIIDNFESLSGIEDNDESDTFKTINPDGDYPNGVYWLEYNVAVNNITKQILLFEHNNIFTNKPPRYHISKLIKKYGARTQKINNQDYCSAIFERHESIRFNFLNYVRASVEDTMTIVALKIGMCDGKAPANIVSTSRDHSTSQVLEVDIDEECHHTYVNFDENATIGNPVLLQVIKIIICFLIFHMRRLDDL